VTTPTAPASLPVIKALLDEAARKHFTGGVLGVRAVPEWSDAAQFEHNGVAVRVVVCPSALAVREALTERTPHQWLVVLTDRDEKELGLGITAHLTWQRLRRPDPWAAVQDRFSATLVDHRLVSGPHARELATGLLAATPPTGWPPARAGLLTADHVFGALASHRMGLGQIAEQPDLAAVLHWSARPDAAPVIANLRVTAGDPLVEALLAWLTERCGGCGQALGPLLREGRPGDAVPLGLIARVIAGFDPGSGPRALFAREVGRHLAHQVLLAWAADAEAATRDLVAGDQDAAARVLARAESLLDRVEAGSLAAHSTVLRSGLTSRLAALGQLLHRCADRAATRARGGAGPDAPLADAALLPEIEDRRVEVEAHALHDHPDEVRVPRALAAVRLVRWLAQAVPPAAGGLGALVARHRDEDAWVDRAVADVWAGVHDEALAQGLRAVLGAVRLRRAAHDVAFGRALAAHEERGDPAPTGAGYLEDLLATTVLPLARTTPVLLVLADGMSQAVATEIVDDVVRRYDTWLECLPADADRRRVALAPLPSLTAVCRASFFTGELTVGEQQVEHDGLAALAKSHAVTARLFHKLALDRSGGGYALAHEVRAAVDDVTGTAVVACVLNSIDDALDRSDPGGTDWTADTVKHLRPLLDRARRAGRIVVLTGDHGHVVERREGRLKPEAGMSSNRSRPYAGGDRLDDSEVRIRGRRVLLHDGDAVLAVDEWLRYGPVKAGYHGGASPAEVVVPVSVLAPGEAPPGWRLAPPQSPAWWRGPVSEQALPSGQIASPGWAPGPATSRRPAEGRQESTSAPGGEVLTLFDAASRPVATTPVAGFETSVLTSAIYRQQRDRAARVAVNDEQVGRLLSALLTAPAHRLDPESAAAALGVAAIQLPGALSQVQRLLNVEQYPVLRRDPDGATIVLDVTLLREQFEVGR